MPFNYHGNTSSRVPVSLASCSHVFLRVDAVRRPLTPPYEGPFEVLQRGSKTFLINKCGKSYTVSVDRLKPAATSEIVLPPPQAPSSPSSVSPVVPLETVAAGSDPAVAEDSEDPVVARAADFQSPVLDPVDWPLPTRFGRRPRPPDRLNL